MPFCAGMAASVRFVGVAQNVIFCGAGMAWRPRSEVQRDGTVMMIAGYNSGLRTAASPATYGAERCLVSARTPWSRHRRLLGAEVDTVVMGTCTAPLITTKIP